MYRSYGALIFIPLILFTAVGILAQWNLYEKCGLKGVACIVPVWNVIEFLKIMGRPAWHIVFFLIPVYNIYFIIKVYIELCNSFGRYSIGDYILVILLNGLYVLYLGLAEEEVYKGPVYKQRMDMKASQKGGVKNEQSQRATA